MPKCDILGPFFSLSLTLSLAFMLYLYYTDFGTSNASRVEQHGDNVLISSSGCAFGCTDDLDELDRDGWGAKSIKKTIFYYPETIPEPVSSYPPFRSLLDIVAEWNPDHPDPSGEFKETLQHFNYSDEGEREMAAKYRDAEVPFKLYNIPELEDTMNKWSESYLIRKMKNQQSHTEKSNTNHFMYWNMGAKKDRNYKPPTEIVPMSYQQWLKLATKADRTKLSNDSAHYYFMMGSPPMRQQSGRRSFISNDLPFFSTRRDNFFVTNVKANKGIQCRFGMRGVIAESHFDAGRNMVAMLKGAKRYILNPPQACKSLGIISEAKHPSYRHSVLDWSDLKQAASSGFQTVDALDTILKAGEMLYIPSFWFHYIISMERSIQCNSRSGTPPTGIGQNHIESCFGKNSLKFSSGKSPKRSKKKQKVY